MGRDREYAQRIRRSATVIANNGPETTRISKRHRFDSETEEATYSPMEAVSVPRSIRTSSDAIRLQQIHGNHAVTHMIQAKRQAQGVHNPTVVSTAPPNVVARVPLTRQEKLAKIETKIKIIEGIVAVLSVGHGVVMLPSTLIDALVSIFRKNQNDTGKGLSLWQKFKRLKVHIFEKGAGLTLFLNGKTKDGGKLSIGPKIGHWKPFDLANMPWNVFSWLARPFNFWLKQLRKKSVALKN